MLLNSVKFLSGYIKEKSNFGRSNLRCLHCDYSSVHITHMKRHILKHSGKRPFSCSSCDFTTYRTDCLKVHIWRKHPV